MLTGSEAKQARQSIGLSQTKVTRETGISTTDISRFENGHINLSNEQSLNLLNFYIEQGADIPLDELKEMDSIVTDSEDGTQLEAEELALPIREQQKHIDGFLIPEGMAQEKADALIFEYHRNRDRISEYLEQPVPRTPGMFFGGDVRIEEVLINVLIPMAENYAIIDQLQGNSKITAWETVDNPRIDKSAMVDTYKDAVEHMFTTALNREAM